MQCAGDMCSCLWADEPDTSVCLEMLVTIGISTVAMVAIMSELIGAVKGQRLLLVGAGTV